MSVRDLQTKLGHMRKARKKTWDNYDGGMFTRRYLTNLDYRIDLVEEEISNIRFERALLKQQRERRRRRV